MSKIKLFSGKDYELQYDWDNGQIQAEDGNSSLGHGKAFIEIFYDHFHIRGDGSSIIEAEDNAWIKYSKYLSCNDKHDYERKSDSGLGFCRTCHITTRKLANISKCTCCNRTGVVLYIGNELHCLEHFIEKAKQLEPIYKNKHAIKNLITIEFLFYHEKVDECTSDEEIYSKVTKIINYGEKSLFNFCIDEIDKVLCTDEPKDFESSCDLFDEICMDKDNLWILISQSRKSRYGKRKVSKELKNLFISKSEKYNLKVKGV
jgi:hypothetical protein